MQKQNQKRFILPVVIILITVAVLGTGGYFTYRYLSKSQNPTPNPSASSGQDAQPNPSAKNSNNNNNPIVCTQDAKQCPDGSYVGRTGPKCEFAPCPAVVDSTAGWKTYTNTQYGFEIKYPVNWKLSEEYGVLFYPAEYEKEAVSCYGGSSFGGCNAHKISIVIQPYTNIENYWLWNIIANKSNIKAPLKMPVDDLIIKDSKTVNLGDNKVVEVIDGFGPGNWQRNYFVIDSPEKQSLIIFHSENNKNPISIVTVAEEMLSTFKFTK